jgi:hypothetical protein
MMVVLLLLRNGQENGSTLVIVVYLAQRKTRANSDIALCTHLGTYLGTQGTPFIVMLEDEQGSLCYAHRVMVDELQHDLAIAKCNPASCFLSGQLVDTGHCGNILRELDTLEVSSDQWLPNNMSQAIMPSVPLATQLGICYKYLPLFGRCHVKGFEPESPAAIHLTRYHPIGKFILTINGTPVRTVEDVSGCFRFHLERKQGLDSLTLLLASMGVEIGSDAVQLGPQDNAQLHSIFSLDATSSPSAPPAASSPLSYILDSIRHCHVIPPDHHDGMSLPSSTDAPFLAHLHPTKGGGLGPTDVTLPVAVAATIDAFDTSRFSIVGSIAGSNDAYLVTPKHWGVAMKSPYKHKWLDGLFKHLNGCLQYGTYGMPQIPPADVIVLPTMLALRNKLDSQSRLDECKVCMCVNGSQQIQGLDYDESYAPAILGTTLCIQISLSILLGLPMWHMDVSNAFQSMPAPVVEGKRIWLRCFPEYIAWLKEKHPDLWKQVDELAKRAPPHLLALEMFKMVQERVDASRGKN